MAIVGEFTLLKTHFKWKEGAQYKAFLLHREPMSPSCHFEESLDSRSELFQIGVGIIRFHVEKRQTVAFFDGIADYPRLYIISMATMPGKVDDAVNPVFTYQPVEQGQPAGVWRYTRTGNLQVAAGQRQKRVFFLSSTSKSSPFTPVQFSIHTAALRIPRLCEELSRNPFRWDSR